jgi:hypothetical protein
MLLNWHPERKGKEKKEKGGAAFSTSRIQGPTLLMGM